MLISNEARPALSDADLQFSLSACSFNSFFNVESASIDFFLLHFKRDNVVTASVNDVYDSIVAYFINCE